MVIYGDQRTEQCSCPYHCPPERKPISDECMNPECDRKGVVLVTVFGQPAGMMCEPCTNVTINDGAQNYTLTSSASEPATLDLKP